MDFNYVGCFLDEDTRALNGTFINSDGVTAESCANFCQEYEYFGLQASNWVRSVCLVGVRSVEILSCVRYQCFKSLFIRSPNTGAEKSCNP